LKGTTSNSLSRPNYDPKAPSPHTITPEVRISACDLGDLAHNTEGNIIGTSSLIT
jgi:hypothetical protein